MYSCEILNKRPIHCISMRTTACKNATFVCLTSQPPTWEYSHLPTPGVVFAPSSSTQTMTLLKSVRMRPSPTAAHTNESPIFCLIQRRTLTSDANLLHSSQRHARDIDETVNAVLPTGFQFQTRARCWILYVSPRTASRTRLLTLRRHERARMLCAAVLTPQLTRHGLGGNILAPSWWIGSPHHITQQNIIYQKIVTSLLGIQSCKL